VAPLFAGNRRDGSRLLSSALIVTAIALVRLDTTIGQLIAGSGTLLCLYWWLCYRRLER
jgi:hypothetical protein